MEKLAWPSLEGRRKVSRSTMFHRVVNLRNVDIGIVSSHGLLDTGTSYPVDDIVNIKFNDIFKSAVRDHLVKQGEWL